MKRISGLVVDGTESLTERTVPQAHKSVVDYIVCSRAHPDLRIDPNEHHHSPTTACFERIRRLTFNVGHITTTNKLKGWDEGMIPSWSDFLKIFLATFKLAS